MQYCVRQSVWCGLGYPILNFLSSSPNQCVDDSIRASHDRWLCYVHRLSTYQEIPRNCWDRADTQQIPFCCAWWSRYLSPISSSLSRSKSCQLWQNVNFKFSITLCGITTGTFVFGNIQITRRWNGVIHYAANGDYRICLTRKSSFRTI